MTQEVRLDSLRQRHEWIEACLNDEERRPLPDSAILSQLKRQKLRLKDEMGRLARYRP